MIIAKPVAFVDSPKVVTWVFAPGVRRPVLQQAASQIDSPSLTVRYMLHARCAPQRTLLIEKFNWEPFDKLSLLTIDNSYLSFVDDNARSRQPLSTP